MPIESAPDAMVIVDAEGTIVLVNAQVERLFGYRREELIGQPVEMLVPDRFRAGHPQHRAKYGADPHTWSMGADLELHGRRNDDSVPGGDIPQPSRATRDPGRGLSLQPPAPVPTGQLLAPTFTNVGYLKQS